MSLLDGLSNITSLKWKLIAGGAGLALVGVSLALGSEMIENRHLTKLNTNLGARINDPETGYVRQIAQAQTNAANLQGQIDTQNRAIQTLSDNASTALAESSRKVAAAQVQTRKAEAQVAVLLSRKPQGATLDERIRDVDARVLETLK